MTNLEIEQAQELYLNVRRKHGINHPENAFAAGAEYARDIVRKETVEEILALLEEYQLLTPTINDVIKGKYNEY